MKKHLLTLCFAIVLGLLQAAFLISPWGESLERRFLDRWFNLRGPLPPPRDVVIVAMDDQSFGILGFSPNQPWPRSAHAQLIERLAKVGARVVVFDVLFLGPGPDPSADQKLAAALRLMPTVLGAEFGTIEVGAYSRQELQLPDESFRASAHAVGLVSLPEEEGFVRRFLTLRPELTQGLPTLDEAAVGKKPGEPGLPHPQDLINFYGPPGTILTVPYAQALETENPLPPGLFRDKIVFVGQSLRADLANAKKDASLTSFSSQGRMFGVEIHATVTANLLANNWIRRAPRWVETVSLSVVAAGLGAVLGLLRPQWGAVLLVGYALGWMGVAYTSFNARRFVPGAGLSTIVLPAGYLATTLYYYIITRRQERQLERAFQFYLSPEMAREVARNPQALRLGGEEVVATALFTDIEGFTPTVESMRPEEVARMLNTYFTEVMDAVFERKGTLVQFIGDAVFALWGAPIKTPDHARLACEAALCLERDIAKFNASGRFPRLRTRIGLHTGLMIVGNMGCARRFNFSGIGDTVNLASRVEGLNKYFGTEILLTDTVRAGIGDSFACLKLGAIRVVGKKKIIGLHTLFADPVSAEGQSRWADALAEFVARRWEVAAGAFSELAHAEPRLQKAAALYVSQTEQHRLKSPAEDWQGEIVFSSK